MSDSTMTPEDSAGHLAELEKHLEARSFEAAAEVVRALHAGEDPEAVSACDKMVGGFMAALPDGLASAATLIRVYQHLGDVLPQDSPVFQTLLQKLKRILHVSVPGEEALSACDALERALQLFAPKLRDVPGFTEAREELVRLRRRSRNVIRSHKEQELQALVATGNLEAAIGLCREMIDEGISTLAVKVLPILEREGASPAAVAYLLSAANQAEEDDAESLHAVTWEPISPQHSGESGKASSHAPVGQQARKAWELTFQEIPKPGDQEPQAVDRAARPAPHEAAWTAPGRGEGRAAEAPPVSGASTISTSSDRGEGAQPSRGRPGTAVGARLGKVFRKPVRKPAPGRVVQAEKAGAEASRSPSPPPSSRPEGVAKGSKVTSYLASRWVSALLLVLVVVSAWWVVSQPGVEPGGQTGISVPEPSPGEAGGEQTGRPGTEDTGEKVATRLNRTPPRDPDIPDPAQRPQGPPGTLTLDIVPPDSLELYLNGNLIPDGKIEARSVPPGKQIVVVYREGYEPLRKELWVAPNAAVNDKLVLHRSPRLSLVVTPDVRAEVRLDGRRMWVKLPISDVAIPVGKHRLEVSYKGYKTWSKAFDAKSGENLSFEAELEPGR